MQVGKDSLLELLGGKFQYVIPVYQRKYEWTVGHCKQLLHDIIAASKKEGGQTHFTGAVIYSSGVDQSWGVRQRFITDGQQRITTAVLLVVAIAQVLAEKSSGRLRTAAGTSLTTSKKLIEDYIINANEDGAARYKLVLRGPDWTDLQNIIDNPTQCAGTSSHLLENFNYFLSRLRSLDNLEAVVQGLRRLQIASIVLETGLDNPQVIFESFNSKGLPLSQSDLIRNYLLMGLTPNVQEKAYVECWLPMEECLASTNNEGVFDKFIKDYLTLKTSRIPKIADIYPQFKEFVESQSVLDNVAITEELAHFATLYARIALNAEPDKHLRDAFARLRDLKVEAARPFFLGVYDDFQNNVVSLEEFRRLTELIESYVFRRTVCGLPANRRAKLLGRISGKVESDNYVQSVEDVLMSLSGLDRFPSDLEFKEALLKNDCYNLAGARYLFLRLETHGSKEPLAAAGLSIEHILPQGEDLNEEWQRALGPDWKVEHAACKHLLGNLTLTGYNSEMSNMSFHEKRTKPGTGFLVSGLRLNEYVRECTSWTPVEIAKRGEMLAEKALLVWPGLAGAEQKQSALSVRFPDGTTIQRSTSSKTLVAVLERIGLDTVATLGLRLNGQDLVSTQKHARYASKQIGTWHVAVHSNTQAKVDVLQRIATMLNLPLVVTRGPILAATGIPSAALPTAQHAPNAQMPFDLAQLAKVMLTAPQSRAA